jgi:hypothetical protein
MAFPLPGANWSYLHSPRLVATTGIGGFALVDGTPQILSWTAPNDGQLHRAMVYFDMTVGSAQTGGAVSVSGFAPDGTEYFWQVAPGGSGAGYVYYDSALIRTVKPGTVLALGQSTAQTAGAAKIWAEIWALLWSR